MLEIALVSMGGAGKRAGADRGTKPRIVPISCPIKRGRTPFRPLAPGAEIGTSAAAFKGRLPANKGGTCRQEGGGPTTPDSRSAADARMMTAGVIMKRPSTFSGGVPTGWCV